jgi:tripartite-type tricarboxylate transporter receptor subunit TctC
VHLGSALFETVTGTEMQHVIYKETSQLYTGVATGELAFAMGTSATAGPLYRAGKLKFLAIACTASVTSL